MWAYFFILYVADTKFYPSKFQLEETLRILDRYKISSFNYPTNEQCKAVEPLFKEEGIDDEKSISQVLVEPIDTKIIRTLESVGIEGKGANYWKQLNSIKWQECPNFSLTIPLREGFREKFYADYVIDQVKEYHEFDVEFSNLSADGVEPTLENLRRSYMKRVRDLDWYKIKIYDWVVFGVTGNVWMELFQEPFLKPGPDREISRFFILKECYDEKEVDFEEYFRDELGEMIRDLELVYNFKVKAGSYHYM
ncbi:MAG: hypothetical protein ACFFCS_03010 [Candidatus Hodarchaeota archaeon]